MILFFHIFGHLSYLIRRIHRVSERLHRKSHELHRVVVGGDAVGVELAAYGAAVDERPFAALAHPDTDRLHASVTFRRAVARLVVEVDARQAVWAVVAVVGSGTLGNYLSSAVLAGERVDTGVLLEKFRVVFAFFVLSVHC